MRWKNIPAQILICKTSREVSEQKTLGTQGPLSLNVPQWHIDYFKLKLLREDPMQESSQVTLVVKNPPANAGDIKDAGSIPGLGRSPGGGHSNPFQYSCLENPINRGAWWPTVHRVAKSQTRLTQLGMMKERQFDSSLSLSLKLEINLSCERYTPCIWRLKDILITRDRELGAKKPL